MNTIENIKEYLNKDYNIILNDLRKSGFLDEEETSSGEDIILDYIDRYVNEFIPYLTEIYQLGVLEKITYTERSKLSMSLKSVDQAISTLYSLSQAKPINKNRESVKVANINTLSGNLDGLSVIIKNLKLHQALTGSSETFVKLESTKDDILKIEKDVTAAYGRITETLKMANKDFQKSKELQLNEFLIDSRKKYWYLSMFFGFMMIVIIGVIIYINLDMYDNLINLYIGKEEGNIDLKVYLLKLPINLFLGFIAYIFFSLYRKYSSMYDQLNFKAVVNGSLDTNIKQLFNDLGDSKLDKKEHDEVTIRILEHKMKLLEQIFQPPLVNEKYLGLQMKAGNGGVSLGVHEDK